MTIFGILTYIVKAISPDYDYLEGSMTAYMKAWTLIFHLNTLKFFQDLPK